MSAPRGLEARAPSSVSKPSLRWLIDHLASIHGPAPEPFPTDPFELILWENVAYLVDDERRRKAFEALRRSIGTGPQQLLYASQDQLFEVSRHGILAQHFATKLRSAAEIAWTEFGGSLDQVLDKPAPAAKRALRRFPGIGEPGAEKILLYNRRHPFLAPESNGLRVLVRFGICPAGDSYANTYAAARAVAQTELGDDFDALIAARYYLRTHGRLVCWRSAPDCATCSVQRECLFPEAPDEGHSNRA